MWDKPRSAGPAYRRHRRSRRPDRPEQSRSV